MSGPDPIGNETRRARRERRLGSNAVCLHCGRDDSAVLIRVERSLIEHHHPLGVLRASAVTVPLCRNCHVIETERMRDASIPLDPDAERSIVEVVEIVLRAAAIFLRSLADAFDQFADRLRRLIAELDRRFPGWRELEWGTI